LSDAYLLILLDSDAIVFPPYIVIYYSGGLSITVFPSAIHSCIAW